VLRRLQSRGGDCMLDRFQARGSDVLKRLARRPRAPRVTAAWVGKDARRPEAGHVSMRKLGLGQADIPHQVVFQTGQICVLVKLSTWTACTEKWRGSYEKMGGQTIPN
jgi:hypothetical protein